MLRFRLLLTLSLLALAGCSALFERTARTPDPEPAAEARPAQAGDPRPDARPASSPAAALGRTARMPELLDQTRPEERAAATAPAAAQGQFLGTSLASLGNPAESGFWLRTGLVSSVTSGRIELASGTGSLALELRPSGAAPGAGSQLSLAAFRTLDRPLTEIIALRVYAQ